MICGTDENLLRGQFVLNELPRLFKSVVANMNRSGERKGNVAGVIYPEFARKLRLVINLNVQEKSWGDLQLGEILRHRGERAPRPLRGACARRGSSGRLPYTVE